MNRFARALTVVLPLVLAACSSGVQPHPMQLDGGILTVDNRTEHDWQDVEIWLNQYYRVAPDVIT